MTTQTSLVAEQVRLQQWAEQVRDCKNRPRGMDVETWCAQNNITKIEMLYCKRQQEHCGMEKLKTEKIDKVILSKEQWENETGKIKLLELWNCIPFEK